MYHVVRQQYARGTDKKAGYGRGNWGRVDEDIEVLGLDKSHRPVSASEVLEREEALLAEDAVVDE